MGAQLASPWCGLTTQTEERITHHEIGNPDVAGVEVVRKDHKCANLADHPGEHLCWCGYSWV